MNNRKNLGIGRDEDIEELANKAIEQMDNKEYTRELVLDKCDTIYKYAIVFYDGKKCIVR